MFYYTYLLFINFFFQRQGVKGVRGLGVGGREFLLIKSPGYGGEKNSITGLLLPFQVQK